MAGFQPGKPRPPGAGRKAGTPNKRTQALDALKDKARLDPLDFFRAVLEGDAALLKEDPSLDQRITAAKELAGYLYPKRKAIEVTGEAAPLVIKLKWPEEGDGGPNADG
jgi:hypothetical protein